MPDNEHLMATDSPDWGKSPSPEHPVCVVCSRRADESGLCRDHRYDDQPCCSYHDDCHLPGELICCDQCPDMARCPCGHGWHLHDPEAVPVICMSCGNAARCPGPARSTCLTGPGVDCEHAPECRTDVVTPPGSERGAGATDA